MPILEQPFHLDFPLVICYAKEATSDDLCQEEQQYCKNLGKGVAEQFCMGRKAAHEGLGMLNADGPVLRGEKGEPLWPDGICGSISHTSHIAVASVAKREACLSLGLDIEHLNRLMNLNISRKIASEKEIEWIEKEDSNRRERTLALFSAKEALYKALFPLEQVYFGFFDVELSPCKKGFQAELKKRASEGLDKGAIVEINQMKWEDELLSLVYLAES